MAHPAISTGASATQMDFLFVAAGELNSSAMRKNLFTVSAREQGEQIAEAPSVNAVFR